MVHFDANIWYQITETRAGFENGLKSWGEDMTGIRAWNISNLTQHWQILPYISDSNTYAFRNRGVGTSSVLATVYDPDEVDPSHTQPRLLPINPGDSSQQWTFGNWSDNTLFIINVKNGSAFHLDVHPRDSVFLSSQTAPEPNDPGQHWEIQTIEPINDAGWSTTLSSTPTSSATSTVISLPAAASSTAAASSPGLSTGAKIGIGVGAGVAVLILISALLFLFLKRRANGINEYGGQSGSGNGSSILGTNPWMPVHEISGDHERFELSNTEHRPVELPTSIDQKSQKDQP